jgi:hypothetical protein
VNVSRNSKNLFGSTIWGAGGNCTIREGAGFIVWEMKNPATPPMIRSSSPIKNVFVVMRKV